MTRMTRVAVVIGKCGNTARKIGIYLRESAETQEYKNMCAYLVSLLFLAYKRTFTRIQDRVNPD